MPDSLPPVGVGRIVGLWRYPVKSMAGEALPEVGVSWHGFAGDRRWAFGRCVVITLDPVTAEREPKILRAVASDRQGCLGVYASTVEPGTVALGDAVYLEG